MTDLNSELDSLEAYGSTLLDTANRSSGIARTEIVELNRRIAAVRAAAGSSAEPEAEAQGEADDDTDAGAAADDEGADKPVSRMNKAELVQLAEDRGITVAEDATVAELRDALRDD